MCGIAEDFSVSQNVQIEFRQKNEGKGENSVMDGKLRCGWCIGQ